MQLAEPPDAVLAVEARKGSRRAFDQLIQRHRLPIFRIARHYLGTADDAFDILQETFVSAWLGLGRYDPARDFGAWLRTIALNKCRDFSRRQGVRRKLLRLFSLLEVRDGSAASQEAVREGAEFEARRLAALEAAIAALPAAYKEPLLLTAFAGLSQRDAALQLGTTTKAIEMRVRRARQQLEIAMQSAAADEA